MLHLISKTFSLQFEKGSLERSYEKMLYSTYPSLILPTLPLPVTQRKESAQATNARQTQMISAVVPVPHHMIEAAMPIT
jgi:hypothetical protein